MRDQRFMFLCTGEERQMLASLAQRLARTESDVVRLLIREAAQGLGLRTNEATTDRTAGGEQGEPTASEPRDA